ncbi:cobalt ECF transporter T component CbiQ [Clostridium sp. LBM24168]
MGKIVIFKWRHNYTRSSRLHHHGEGFPIDFYAYNSKMKEWNSTFKVLFSILTLVLCVSLDNQYVSAAVIIAMAYLTVVKGGLPIYEYLSILTIPIAFIILGTFPIAIDFSRQPIGQYNLYLGFCYAFTSREKLKEVLFLILKVFASVSALQLMALSTPSSEIIYVFKKAHVPKIIVELMNIIYRYIFILMEVYTNMKNSAKSREGYYDFKTSCATFGGIVSNILIVSLKKAEAYYDAMEARCYDGELVFWREDKSADIKHIVAAVLFIFFLILLWAFT